MNTSFNKTNARPKLFVTEKIPFQKVRKLSTSPLHNQLSDRSSYIARRNIRKKISNKSYTPDTKNKTHEINPYIMMKDIESLYRKDILPESTRKFKYGNHANKEQRNYPLSVTVNKLNGIVPNQTSILSSRYEEKGKKINNLKKIAPLCSEGKAINLNFTTRNGSPKRGKGKNEDNIRMKVDNLILSYIKKGMIKKNKI